MPAALDIASFEILVNGTALGGQYGLLSIATNSSVNKIPVAKIVLMDGDNATQDFPHSNEDLFAPGAEIQVNAGYGSDKQAIFHGIITKHGIKINNYENPSLELECRHKAIVLTGARKNKVYNDVKDADIFDELIGAASIDKDVETTNVTHKEMVQYNCTDWDFIVTRAELNGKWVLINENKIEIKAPAAGSAETTFNFGMDTYEFEAEIDARDQFPAVKAKTWNYTNQEITESEASEPSLASQGDLDGSTLSGVMEWEDYTVYHGGKIDETENKAWADSRLLYSRLSRIQGRIRVSGQHSYTTGTLINFQGFGNRFNGTTVITGVNHYFNNEMGWYCDLQFGITKDLFAQRYDDVVEKPASGLLPAVNGLQIGIVTAIHEDPDGESRVKVKLPLVDNEGEGIWARMTAPDAGNSHGWVFFPELNDEVVLGFLNDDPRNAIILGKLYSSGLPPMIEGTEDNNEKGIFTRSGMKLVFNDESPSVTIETPGGYSVVIDEAEGSIVAKDANNNTLTLSSDGITLESGADITLKATGDVKIEGVNVEISASAQFKGEGSAGSEISSGGNTTIKGSMVQIN